MENQDPTLNQETPEERIFEEGYSFSAEEIAAFSQAQMIKVIEFLQGNNAVLFEVNKELTLKVEELSTAAPSKAAALPTTVSNKTFSVDGEEHEFVFAKITSKGRTITADEVLASIDLQRELVAKKSGFIRKCNPQ